jgi:hypothetical protein
VSKALQTTMCDIFNSFTNHKHAYHSNGYNQSELHQVDKLVQHFCLEGLEIVLAQLVL